MLKKFCIFALLVIHFAFSMQHINAVGFNESYSSRGGLLTVNEGGITYLGMAREIICGIYKITSPSSKIYVGQAVNIYLRWNAYKNLQCKQQILLCRSLKKYGWEAHTKEIIHKCSEEELNKWEIYYIKEFDCFDTQHGLNLQSGGGDYRHSEKTKKKMSINNARYNLGKHLSEKTKRKISKALKGRVSWNKGVPCSEITKEKLRQTNLGNKHTEETKRKMSINNAKTNLGKHLSRTTKEKLSRLYKGKTLEQIHGENRAIEIKKKISMLVKRAWAKKKLFQQLLNEKNI